MRARNLEKQLKPIREEIKKKQEDIKKVVNEAKGENLYNALKSWVPLGNAMNKASSQIGQFTKIVGGSLAADQSIINSIQAMGVRVATPPKLTVGSFVKLGPNVTGVVVKPPDEHGMAEISIQGGGTFNMPVVGNVDYVKGLDAQGATVIGTPEPKVTGGNPTQFEKGVEAVFDLQGIPLSIVHKPMYLPYVNVPIPPIVHKDFKYKKGDMQMGVDDYKIELDAYTKEEIEFKANYNPRYLPVPISKIIHSEGT
jgi:hypothetical protein